jgi:hypothetical protein
MGAWSGTCHVQERKEVGGLTGKRWVTDIGPEPMGAAAQLTHSAGEPKQQIRRPGNCVGF